MADREFISIERSPMILPNFRFSDVLSYVQVLTTAYNYNNTFYYEIKAGEKLFKDKFVSSFASSIDDVTERLFIKANVKAAMVKSKSYRVDVVLDRNKQVINGKCGCPGGVEPACCKHVFAVLFALNEYSSKELYKTPTEKLQTWHVPRPKLTKPKKAKDKLKSSVTENIDNSVDFSALEALPQWTPILSILSVISESTEIFYAQTMPLPAFVTSGFGDVGGYYSNIEDVIYYHEHVRYAIDEIVELEKSTMAQGTGSSNLWMAERRKRITATNVFDIIHSRDIPKTLAKILSPKDLSFIPAVRYGKEMEPTVKFKVQLAYKDHKFRDVGLCIHPLYPFIAASPDGLLFNREGKPMLVEIKCVFNQKRETLEELSMCRKDFFLERNASSGLFSLKPSHKYYYQVQMQLFCSNLLETVFVVFFGSQFPLHTEVITFDKAFVSSLFPKICHNYFNGYLPMLKGR